MSTSPKRQWKKSKSARVNGEEEVNWRLSWGGYACVWVHVRVCVCVYDACMIVYICVVWVVSKWDVWVWVICVCVCGCVCACVCVSVVCMYGCVCVYVCGVWSCAKRPDTRKCGEGRSLRDRLLMSPNALRRPSWGRMVYEWRLEDTRVHSVCVCVNHLNRCKTSTCLWGRFDFAVFRMFQTNVNW